MTYNMTALGNAGSIYGLIVVANDATSTVMINLFLLALFIVILLALKRYDFLSGLVVSSYICFIIAALLAYAELLALMWVLLYLIIAAFSTMLLFLFK